MLQSVNVGNKGPKMAVWNMFQKIIIDTEVGDWTRPNRRSWRRTWERVHVPSIGYEVVGMSV